MPLAIITKLRQAFEELRKRLISQRAAAVSHVVSREALYITDFALLETTLDYLNQGLGMVDPNGQILIFNRRGLEYSGVNPANFKLPASAKDVFAEQWRNGEFGEGGSLLPPDVRDYFLTGKGTLNRSYIRRRPNGTILEVRTEPLPNGGYVQTYTDISEIALAKEAAEEAARAKSAFLAMMSHEIRTPLNGVLGIATLLSRSPLIAEQRNWVRIILDSGDSLMSIINDILDLSKFESGAIEFDPIPVRLADLARSALDVVEVQARHKGLKFQAEFGEGLPPCVKADAKRLRQILVNLLGNAVKFTERGSVTLTVNGEPHGDRARLRFEIKDTGIGIPAHALDKLFREFSQVDASISRRFGGTGLGLAICKKIVDAMGGRIGVESAEGKGSTFWFEIEAPLSDAPEEDPASVTYARDSGRSHHILLVEDMPVNRIVGRGMLASLGHKVEFACDGQEALEKLKTTRYDLVFMDMQMPGMDGLETTRRIRQWGGIYADLPIVAMTANAFQSDRTDCLAAGMNDFVSKPIEIDELAAAIRRVMPVDANAVAAVPQPLLCDTHKLKTLTDYIGSDGLAEILEEFGNDSRRFLEQLHGALASADGKAAVAALETLREATTTLGMTEAAAAANLWSAEIGEGGAMAETSLEPLRTRIEQSIAQAQAWLAERRSKATADLALTP